MDNQRAGEMGDQFARNQAAGATIALICAGVYFLGRWIGFWM